MIKKKIAEDRKIFKTKHFKAFALVLRTEIQKTKTFKKNTEVCLRPFSNGIKEGLCYP